MISKKERKKTIDKKIQIRNFRVKKKERNFFKKENSIKPILNVSVIGKVKKISFKKLFIIIFY